MSMSPELRKGLEEVKELRKRGVTIFCDWAQSIDDLIAAIEEREAETGPEEPCVHAGMAALRKENVRLRSALVVVRGDLVKSDDFVQSIIDEFN